MTTIINLGLFATLLFSAGAGRTRDGFDKCLPAGIDANSLVLVDGAKSPMAGMPRRTSVNQRLIQLKARCKRGKLIDGKGTQIYFYALKGCWGNPPADYLDVLKRQELEIQRLKRKYTVIQIPCSESVDPRTISQNSR